MSTKMPEVVNVGLGSTPESAGRKLDASDRCEDKGCGAQAYVEVEIVPATESKDSTELLFCAHHFTVHEVKLVGAGYSINDQRASVLADDR